MTNTRKNSISNKSKPFYHYSSFRSHRMSKENEKNENGLLVSYVIYSGLDG